MRPLDPTPPCQKLARRRVRGLGAATIPAVVLSAVLTANPAFAANEPTNTSPVSSQPTSQQSVPTITSKDALTTAVQGATSDGSTITLGADLAGDGGSDDTQTLKSNVNLTIDLNGFELDLDRIVVGKGSTLTITDSSSSSTKALTVGTDAGTAYYGTTGITLLAGATVDLAGGATVKAKGTDGLPGIGVTGDDAAMVKMDGNSRVTAVGGSDSAGIGGGKNSSGATVKIADTAQVSASGGSTSSTGVANSIGSGTSGASNGSLSVGASAKLRVADLTIAKTETATNAGLIAVDGTLGGEGTLTNNGVIRPGAKAVVKSGAVAVNNFLVSYDKGDGTGDVPAQTRIFAPTLGSVDLDPAAAKVDQPGHYFTGWQSFSTSGLVTVDKTTPLKTIVDDDQNVVLHAILRAGITVAPDTLSAATVGYAYTGSVAAAGDDITGYDFKEGSALPAGLKLDEETGEITGTPTAASDKASTFTVVVTSTHESKEQTYSIAVGAQTKLITSDLKAAVQGKAFSTTLKASGTGSFTYAVVGTGKLPAGLELNTATGEISGTAKDAGVSNFSIKASSASYKGAPEGGDTASYTLTVQSVPTFTSPSTLYSPVGKNDFSAKIVAGDLDSKAAEKAVTYEVKAGGKLPDTFSLATDGTLTGRASVLGDYAFTVIAHGVHGDTEQQLTLSVGDVPVITTAASLTEKAVGEDYKSSLAATGQHVAFAVRNGSHLPTGLTLSKDGVLSGAIAHSSADLTDGAYTFAVTASNEYGSVDRTFSLKAGLKPLVLTKALPDVGLDMKYSTDVDVNTEESAPTTSVVVTGLPAGLAYVDGEITGTASKSGTFEVTVAATNKWGTTTTDPMDLVVGTAPSNFVDTLPTPIVGVPYSQQLGVTGEGKLTYEITKGALPVGLELGADGKITGTPAKRAEKSDGTFSVEITATANSTTTSGTVYGSTSKTYTGSFGAAPALDEVISLPTGYNGQAFTDTKLAVTGDGAKSFSVVKGSLPAGLTLSRTGTLSGTPTATGTDTLSVKVASDFGSDIRIVEIEVQQPATFDTDQLDPVVLKGGQGSVKQEIEVSGDGESIVLAPKGALPAGLLFDKERNTVYGPVTKAGTLQLTFVATGVGAPTEHTYDLQIGAAPVVAAPSFADGVVGLDYSTKLAGDSDGTITWTATGDLPAGISLTKQGVLSGTPTTAGTATFTVTATSIFGSTTTKALTLKVAAKPVVDVPVAAPVQTQAPTPVKTEAPAPVKTTAPAPVQTTPVVVAPAPVPVLPSVPASVALFGHPLAISVAANSATAVTYSVSAGDLPKGIALNAATGAIAGTPADTGTFSATIKATNAAGSSETKLSITVPKIVELVQAKPATPTARIGKPITVKISSLKKGEGFVVRVDGKVKLKGEAKKAGDLSVSVKLPRSVRDKVHTVSVTGDRKVSDPAKRAKTAFTVSTITQRKSLTIKADGTSATVSRLAANESVSVTLSNGKVVAKGKADKSGTFAFSTTSLSAGSHTLIAHGVTDQRTGKIKIKIG